MAEPIRCDVHNLDHLADVMVVQLANGDTMAACHDGYLALARAFVTAADATEAEADATAADAVAALDGEHPTFPTPEPSSDADAPAPEPPTNGAGGDEPAEAGTDTPEEPIGAPGPS